MGYTIKSDIVVPNGYVYRQSALQPGFHQIHMHSTGNPTASVQNERDYLAGHYNAANYTHLVGITNGAVDIRQVMNTNGGAWDVGGDWNWETYAAIELSEGSIKSQADFNKAYPAYIWLARYLAKQAGITYTIDNLNTIGIKSHNYASATGHGSDHVDPIPFLAKWGVSRDKFNHDLVNGIAEQKEENKTTKKVGIKDMLLFKADVDTNFGSKANIYFLNGGIVIRIDSVSTYNELKNSGVPFATFTKKNTESLIDANGGLK
ncbi:N-acetylmuramoyl-L-alanine amidase [Leuconostoc falkenbergense]|uniref:peptidoglycan recognition protein family protein n=1 Tax=Leuconostoc falkenbergense TaxID=2766470 RepID=UPI0021AAE1C8|nr:peptidoglycan recognition family protein [Leuconostoc falkenbergense]MCT4420070.1 N-acetylmuramoyl-L-alanine amidase [Leuconostoc falkenbergense]